jgi:hypothetical protein
VVQMGWGGGLAQTGHMTRRRGKKEKNLLGSCAQTGQKKAKKRAVHTAGCEKKEKRLGNKCNSGG